MKMFKFLSALLVLALSTQSLVAQSKGVISMSSSAAATTADYEKIVSAMKEKGVWETGWSFHAMGAAQPAGLFGIGYYATREACDKRMEVTKPVFEAAGLKPNVQISELYSSFIGALPATKPSAGIVVHFNSGAMTTAQYDQIIVELQKVTTFPPAGQMAHFCYQTTEGLKVIDVWESAEAFNTFGQKLMPILQQMGLGSSQPTIYSLYNYMKTSN